MICRNATHYLSLYKSWRCNARRRNLVSLEAIWRTFAMPYIRHGFDMIPCTVTRGYELNLAPRTKTHWEIFGGQITRFLPRRELWSLPKTKIIRDTPNYQEFTQLSTKTKIIIFIPNNQEYIQILFRIISTRPTLNHQELVQLLSKKTKKILWIINRGLNIHIANGQLTW